MRLILAEDSDTNQPDAPDDVTDLTTWITASSTSDASEIAFPIAYAGERNVNATCFAPAGTGTVMNV